MESNVNLLLKDIGKIKGTFIIPSYQRGYRWGEHQVKTLLNDIWDKAKADTKTFYCLQPIVVKTLDEENKYELIDGQQRFTTILILLNYIKNNWANRIPVNYTLKYETRANSSEYISNLDENRKGENVDFYHIYNANKCIEKWLVESFEEEYHYQIINDLYSYLIRYVQVIWYEVGEDIDPISLFTRLNIGKIKLTNAELIRALFLSEADTEEGKRTQTEMSIQWDNIEKSLCSDNDDFWSFITREDVKKYPTRIEILFDMMCGKKQFEREEYFTFFEIEKRIADKGKRKVWLDIVNNHLQIKGWFVDNEFYHKIGYLIASGSKTMPEIFDEALGKRKSEFRNRLNMLIAESIDFNKSRVEDYLELDYKRNYHQISRLLLLFNVQSILIKEVYQRFPFSKYNNSEWSLEHIHAQHSEGLKTVESQLVWIEKHLESLKAVLKENADDGLFAEMEGFLEKRNITKAQFDSLFARVVYKLSDNSDSEYIHTLSNMALLCKSDNSALSNCTFDVKRNMIVEMDSKGAFIPYCTKMVFLKYYTKSSDNQLHFWGQKDRNAYVNAILQTIKPYTDLIQFNTED